MCVQLFALSHSSFLPPIPPSLAFIQPILPSCPPSGVLLPRATLQRQVLECGARRILSRACSAHFASAVAEVLQRACELDRGSAQARFQLATVYTALGRHEAARLELLAVHEDKPREVSVLVALGRASKKVGRTDDAIRFLNLALEASSAGAGMHAALPALGKRRPATELNRIREELARVNSGGGDDEEGAEW